MKIQNNQETALDNALMRGRLSSLTLVMLIMLVSLDYISTAKKHKPSNHKKNNNSKKPPKPNKLSKGKTKLKQALKKTTPTQTIIPKYPRLSAFFATRPDIKPHSKLTQCDVITNKEQCIYRTIPRKTHCLLFQNLINDLAPFYRRFIARSRLYSFTKHEVKNVQINTCARTMTLITKPQGNFTIFPNVLELQNVEGAITLPIPLGDFQLLAGGEWKLGSLRMKMKFTREHDDTYNIKGFAETELVSVHTISGAFDIDPLPKDAIRVLLQRIGVEDMKIRDCRMYGTIQPKKNIYEIAFSGEPEKEEYQGGRLRLFITNYQSNRNLAILLELQDYSPVTLLKTLYGPSIGRATVLKDRNQTIALYISSQPTSRFSTILTAHGSGRWIHRDSKFDPGAYLLVTLPFPKRKAVDMKIKLLTDSLDFSIPESEKLYSDLALNAILPEKIMHLGVDKIALAKDKDNKMFTKLRILRFKYFLFNDTYLAAAESHLSMEEELAEYMPAAKTVMNTNQHLAYENVNLLNNQTPIVRNKHDITGGIKLIKEHKEEKDSAALEAFFANEVETPTKAKVSDTLTLAESTGLL
ncbi:uncharacterized protein [Clytia hemisphaerica]|uniref:Uncharacterized protein n=1 Tax=Clytia hemisphaerica TaxID=252671 RepID=A0A7M5UR53_9CNID